jgi:phasin family protein
MNKLSQQMIEDGKKLATLTTEFKSEFEKLVSESMPNNK